MSNEPNVSENKEDNAEQEKSFFSVIVHSFFIIPFLIAIFCILLFTAMSMLTNESKTAYDYLEDIKTGGLNKRWQGAFELSKILANPKLLPEDDRFYQEIQKAFEHSKHDDDRVRQYLALAIGRTERQEYTPILIDALTEAKEVNIPSLIYALGMLRNKKSAKALYPYISHKSSRIRSIAMVSLGNIQNPESIPVLRKGIHDNEPNVQWGAAISLAQLGDASGKQILLKLLDREYLIRFNEVDPDEQTNLVISAIESASLIEDRDLRKAIQEISTTDKNMKVRATAMEALK